MEVYRLTGKGQELAQSYRSARTPAMMVIYFLNRRGAATKEQIYEYVPNATSMTLAKLRLNGLIVGGQGVRV